MPNTKKNKVVLAVQGSFGHIDYAAGLLDAFRAHNHAAQKQDKPTIEIAAGSSCVEMLVPLALYLANQNSETSIREITLHGDDNLSLLAKSRIAPPAVRPDVWTSFFSGFVEAQKNLVDAGLKMFSNSMRSGAHAALQPAMGGSSSSNVTGTSQLIAACQDVFMYSSGLPGQIAFNPFFTTEKKVGLEAMCAKTDGPTLFTNATRANDLKEIYLYTGTAPDETQHAKMRGKTHARHVLRLTPEYFFASGARPPYIAPMPVTVEGKTEHWMEGAIGCNPPLTPLIDMDATHILLLRFFSKYEREVPNNNTELNERFLDAIFNIPLQKEIESIKLNSRFASAINTLENKDNLSEDLRHRREIVIIDPADHENPAASAEYIKFLNEEANSLSHFDASIPGLGAKMFDRGFEVGQHLIKDLLKHLPH